MRQRHGFTSWYCALCICAIGLVLDQVAWAQVPNETYDFNITKGIVEFSRGHYAQATDLFEQAQILDPKNPLVYFYQGVVSHELKSFNQSSALFSRAMALSPDLTPTVRYYTGISYYERGLLDQAQKEFE